MWAYHLTTTGFVVRLQTARLGKTREVGDELQSRRRAVEAAELALTVRQERVEAQLAAAAAKEKVRPILCGLCSEVLCLQANDKWSRC